jgi:hypothetical protein
MPSRSMLPIHDDMGKSKKIIINGVSFIDLQLKLAKHPTWRILEISRLNFGFKIIFQRTAKEKQQCLRDTVPLRAATINFINRSKAFT